MRIVHAVRSNAFAGVERHITVLTHAQRALGDEVIVIGGDPDRMARQLGREVRHLSASTTAGVATALLRAGRVDVVHVHMTSAEAAAALTQLRHPYVVTRHFASWRGQTALGRCAAPLLRRRHGRQIAVSEFVARAVDGPSTVVYAGVSERALATDRAPWVLVCQRLEPEKQTGLALEAFALSGLATQGWRLVVAGTGRQTEALRDQAAALGIDRQFDLLGFSSDVPALMDEASVLLATAPAEPFGLSVVEAMACGLPVLASAAGGHLESVGRVQGAALYPPGAARTAAQMLRALAHDKRERDAYGRRLQSVQRQFFTPDRQARDTRRVYEDLLE